MLKRYLVFHHRDHVTQSNAFDERNSVIRRRHLTSRVFVVD